MKKAVKSLCFVLIISCVILMSAVVYGFYSLPDEFYSFSAKEIDVGFYTCHVPELEKIASKSVNSSGKYKLNISLFNKIPVKISALTLSDRKYVVPSGEIIGLRVFTDGVMIVGTDIVDTKNGAVNPSRIAKLQVGDIILSIDGQKATNSSFVERVVNESNGRILKITYRRGDNKRSTVITPVYSENEKRYKTGLWIRDSAAGIGTMTFYDKNTGFFASLGHAISDIDTGKTLPLSNGDIVDAKISGCIRGRAGAAGELCGSFKTESLGVLCMNDDFGVFGYLLKTDPEADEIPVAFGSEVTIGPAQIIATVDKEEKEYYDIEIEKLSPEDKNGKNMIIKITDARLLEKTGGIVQGMSGSPVVQNGRLVGAVTHVFLNDPTKGYGIFAETMFESAFSGEFMQAG